MKTIKFFTIVLLCTISLDILACTSAIISGRLTPDGRPLMWKHRDTESLNNRMEWFKGEKYSFLGLVNSESQTGETWVGSNEVGFSIMNTASYNLKDDDVEEMDHEGKLMFKALGECRTLKDFEKFLDSYPRPMRVEANFGVIDAEGGAAYYEVNNTKWLKVDANDPRIAPHGYLVYTNFSYSGRPNVGYGFIRFDNAEKEFRAKSREGNITPVWILNNISRSFYNSLMDLDMADVAAQGSGWISDDDYISRKSSSSSVVIQGLKKGDAANKTILWTTLGYPPVTPTIPLFVAAEEKQPNFVLKSKDSQNSAICDYTLNLKKDVFSQHRGNGQNYLNFNMLSNKCGNGLMQNVVKLDEKIFDSFSPFIENYFEAGAKFSVEEALELQGKSYGDFVR